MPSAFIVGGSGQIGLCIAQTLCADGWDVVVGCRNPPAVKGAWQHVRLDSSQVNALGKAMTRDYDLLVSCIAFDAPDALELLKVQSSVGRIAVISSASVYEDSAGRTLDEANINGFPDFSGPITEQTQTVSPGPETYSTRKIRMENELLDNASIPITVLRPCAIHGPHSKHAREWWFVKRLLDGRKQIPLAYGGKSQFQTTSVSCIAQLIGESVDGQLPTVINVSDADSPSVMQIGHTIMDILDVRAELVPLPDVPYPAEQGGTPWSIEKAFVCLSAVQSEVTYAESVPPTVQWLVEATQRVKWQQLLPQLAGYPRDHFDYRVDEQAIAKVTGQ